jgi:hypothetical protein
MMISYNLPKSVLLAPALLALMMVQVLGGPVPETNRSSQDMSISEENNLSLDGKYLDQLAQQLIKRSLDSSRSKRSGISDQRLAELETLLALKRLRDQQMRSRGPVAYGAFDPDKIGKRRRRSVNLNQLDRPVLSTRRLLV